MRKIRYEIDPYNRLVLAGVKSDLTRFRQVLDGTFKIDEFNNLYYHIKSPLADKYLIPNQLKIGGRWSLTDGCRLQFNIDKSARETFGDRIALEGVLLDARENSLLAALTTAAGEGKKSTYVLNLEGRWKADDGNRLSFHVKREKGRYNILTFDGIWEVNRDHEIVYRYERADLLRKKKRLHSLRFKGSWKIKDRYKLSYVLGVDSDSAFDFRTGAGLFKDGRIQYEIGIGIRGRQKDAAQTVALSGKWYLKKGAGLALEMEYADNKRKTMVFGAEVRLASADTVEFRLKSDVENKDLGITVKLSRRLLKGDGEAFLKGLVSGRESAVYAGGAWRW